MPYAEAFLDNLDASLEDKGISTEHKRFEDSQFSIGLNGVYRLQSDSERALNVVAVPDDGYTGNPQDYAFVQARVLPWQEVAELQDGAKLHRRGELFPGVKSWLVSSDPASSTTHTTFEELEAMVLEKLDSAGL